jgi:enediyne polyketide synthase
MISPIAIVGAACRYPDAQSPSELWENVLAQRQAFRRMPSERLPLADYYSPDPSTPDKTYSQNAALITNWTFDRAKYRVSRSTYDSADLAHWLALEVADAALQDAGFVPPADTTGVVLGNTLTGDSSRANSLRLRWPYVRRAAMNAGVSGEMLRKLEEEFNSPLAAVGEDTLSGGLSNTIAGRICNYFGFHGGGYTVDGACSSSLLSIIHACNALAGGDLDVALAGGVDLSLDPFELIGFAKVTALAKERMWVYDRKANGFLPGEGCGFLVLMRLEDALRDNRRVYASFLGWGMSSDGHGGMTRPEVSGQRMALQRAYAKAGIPIDSVTLFEGHGTGTPVGDPIEVAGVTSLLQSADDHPRFISSVKANIGHTKAAAGIAGVIKTMMALHHDVIPPITGCNEPRDVSPLQVTQNPLPWPENAPRRAGVSAMGFGGINTHVVLEGAGRSAQGAVGSRQESRPSRHLEGELFLFGAGSPEALREQLDRVAARALDLSYAELTDLASALRNQIADRAFRAAFVAATPQELHAAATSAAFKSCNRRPRIAFLFSGQGSIPNVTTVVAQPAIVRASLERLHDLRRLGIEAACAIGHSLGELTALHWSGAIEEGQLIDLATFRGNAMQQLACDGGMAALLCSDVDARILLDDEVVIAAHNGPQQTVVAGAGAAIDRVIERARARGIGATRVPVAAAFHSPMMAPAARPLRDYVAALELHPGRRSGFSTVSGDWLPHDTAIADLLATQLTAPVRFREAVDAVAREADLLIEVGPGRVLTNLASFAPIPVVSSDRVLDAVSAAWLAGADVDLTALFAGRFTRPFDLATRPLFIQSPTESLQSRDARPFAVAATPEPAIATVEVAAPKASVERTTLRELVAKHVDLSLDLVLPTSKLLSDLHLSSITVARLLADAARAMGVPPLADPTSFANATIDEATAALEALRGVEAAPAEPRFPDGVANWLRAFRIDEVPVRAGARVKRSATSNWRILGHWPGATERFSDVKGAGIVAVLPKDDADACIELLLQCRSIADGERLVIVQQAPCGSGFARTLFIERPSVSVRIVNVASLDASAVEHVVTEAEAHGNFCEASYGVDDVRREPRIAVADVQRDMAPPLDERDVLLVTGGGKGIGFESAFHLAQTTGARLLLLGRSKDDEELRANFARLRAASIAHEYVVADVTQPLQRFFNVTAILHAAGSNAPALLDALDETSFRAATAPKLDGLRHVLEAVDPKSLKLLITLGSVIARTGMRGEAHYAFANEWLARATEEFGAAHPQCKAICIEWSVWSGMGMGERLGTMDALRRQGITPVSPDQAVALTLQLASAPPALHVMACGRLGDPPTIRFADDPPPLYRFLEQPRVAIPGVELIVDSELSLRNDPYLEDHKFGGEPLLPAVVGLEAMAQVARTLSGQMPVRIDHVELLQPVTLATMRVAALLDGDRVDLAVRSSSTQFRLDHFRARITVGERPERPRIHIPEGEVDLQPERDLYGPLLFHTGRFRGVKRYRVLTATECVAEVAPHSDPLFHRYLPAHLLLGDATIRDAAIHALQACVPQATVLPQGFASVELFAPVEGQTLVMARETARHADGFVYDVDLASPDGLLFERWRGLRLQVVARRERIDDLAPALWGPFLERELSVAVRVGENGSPVLHRKDGKPLAAHGHISRSHDAGVMLTVSHARPVGIDVQHVNGQVWDDILAPHDGSLTDVCIVLSGDERRFAAARIWSARESMKKLGGDALVPLVVDQCGSHGRVTFRSGPHDIDTFIMRGCVVAVAKERSVQ